jgi:hypothetical protein
MDHADEVDKRNNNNNKNAQVHHQGFLASFNKCSKIIKNLRNTALPHALGILLNILAPCITAVHG